jgi:hypothetical protein
MERRLTGMIAAAAVLIVLFVFWDIFRPTPRAIEQPAEPLRSSADAQNPVAPPVAPPAPPTGNAASEGAAIPTDPNGRQPSYFELLARSETRRRIRASGASTYLGDMLEANGDSMLRRWENRQDSPIRVWFVPTHAANFQPAFLDAIRTAFTKWVDIGVPVRFTFDADSSNAEVTVKWRIQFEIERTGQTDVTWDENGHIQSAVVTLATFDSKGDPMTTEDVRVVAEHEIGHVLGLDHSRDSTDLMFPMAKVRDLSDRDVRTVMLLYQLTPGSLR